MGTASTTSRRPDAAFLVAHPAHFVALGFGAGLAPRAPGTFGTLVGLVLCWILQTVMPPLGVALLAVPLFVIGIWACDVTGRALGVVDDGSIVWDEVVAFLPLAALAAPSVLLQVIAFALFRLFDIWKPFPIRQFERRIPGGLGVMFDDLFAAAYAAFAFSILFTLAVMGGIDPDKLP